MTHREIEEKDTVERYVLDKLSLDERRAFQEHFFGCDECFEQTQSAARFIAAVRHASRSGELEHLGSSGRGSLSSFFRMTPALALVLPVAAMLVLAVAFVWLWFGQIPRMRAEIARARLAAEDTEKVNRAAMEEVRQQLEESRRRLDSEMAERSELEKKLAQSRPGPIHAGAEANLPIVTLDSSRDAQGSTNRVDIPGDAIRLVLWIPVEPGSRFAGFRVQILTKTGTPVEVIEDAGPNQYGALTVAVPASRFQAGQYVVKLYGQRGQHSELLGEYDLKINRH